jgi:hypothetical protein
LLDVHVLPVMASELLSKTLNISTHCQLACLRMQSQSTPDYTCCTLLQVMATELLSKTEAGQIERTCLEPVCLHMLLQLTIIHLLYNCR